mmetsp:Transcript_16504/g.52948  ORF Transcript_16504/g.52948 Transcript_16504/m.52948 type:complete len:466 (-) Transcript_16504:477-1874(-)
MWAALTSDVDRGEEAGGAGSGVASASGGAAAGSPAAAACSTVRSCAVRLKTEWRSPAEEGPSVPASESSSPGASGVLKETRVSAATWPSAGAASSSLPRADSGEAALRSKLARAEVEVARTSMAASRRVSVADPLASRADASWRSVRRVGSSTKWCSLDEASSITPSECASSMHVRSDTATSSSSSSCRGHELAASAFSRGAARWPRRASGLASAIPIASAHPLSRCECSLAFSTVLTSHGKRKKTSRSERLTDRRSPPRTSASESATAGDAVVEAAGASRRASRASTSSASVHGLVGCLARPAPSSRRERSGTPSQRCTEWCAGPRSSGAGAVRLVIGMAATARGRRRGGACLAAAADQRERSAVSSPSRTAAALRMDTRTSWCCCGGGASAGGVPADGSGSPSVVVSMYKVSMSAALRCRGRRRPVVALPGGGAHGATSSRKGIERSPGACAEPREGGAASAM